MKELFDKLYNKEESSFYNILSKNLKNNITLNAADVGALAISGGHRADSSAGDSSQDRHYRRSWSYWCPDGGG